MESQVMIDSLWVIVATVLVFFMNLGFGYVESGFCRSKNTVNIFSKNFIVFAAAMLSFWLIGWGFMFGDGTWFVGLKGLWALTGADNSPAMNNAYAGVYSSIAWTGIPLEAKFFFQLCFAAVAATIISGVVAERIKYESFIVFSFLFVAFIYPICGHWIWGGGWLSELGFWDFAGSTQVHSIGGWAGLTGAIILGPRIGKYSAKGTPLAMPGHNMSLAMIGAFVLWLGWFGFNPGSTMTADPVAIAHICCTTVLAACTGMLSATVMSRIALKKPDIGMAINGSLAGLVSITAPCAFVSLGSAALIGSAAGVFVVLGVITFDRLRIDDPVGALSVHLVNGIFGTLCVGLFAQDRFAPDTTGNGLFYGGGTGLLISQITGIFAVAAYVIVISAIFWYLIKRFMGLRVTSQEEITGLDISEHGNIAYPDFISKRYRDDFALAAAAGVISSAKTERGHVEYGEFTKSKAPIQKIEAIIRPEQLGDVKLKLASVGYPGLMVLDIEGQGRGSGEMMQWRGEMYQGDLEPRIKIEIVVSKADLDNIVDCILESAFTGKKGDGKIFISDYTEAIRIRTKEHGTEVTKSTERETELGIVVTKST
ncbi:MAG: ammonium transporter [Planctomycetota bacterium]|jgi:Amt family ammonium transporter